MDRTEDQKRKIYNNIVKSCEIIFNNPLDFLGSYDNLKENRLDIDTLISYNDKFESYVDHGMKVYFIDRYGDVKSSNFTKDMARMLSVFLWLSKNVYIEQFVRIFVKQPCVKYILPIKPIDEVYHYDLYNIEYPIFNYIDNNDNFVSVKIAYPTDCELFKFFNACDSDMSSIRLHTHPKDAIQEHYKDFANGIYNALCYTCPDKSIGEYIDKHLDIPENIKKYLNIKFLELYYPYYRDINL